MYGQTLETFSGRNQHSRRLRGEDLSKGRVGRGSSKVRTPKEAGGGPGSVIYTAPRPLDTDESYKGLPLLGDVVSLPIIQIAAIAPVAIYLARWRVGVRRRNAQSWDALVARLQPDWSGRELSAHFLSKEVLNTTPEETWERMHGIRGIRAMYLNAGVVLEMVDYAARNIEISSLNDHVLLKTLRYDAMQIRSEALRILARDAFNQASERICSNAFHVASMYTGMAARMAQLLQASAPDMLPDFVAAM